MEKTYTINQYLASPKCLIRGFDHALETIACLQRQFCISYSIKKNESEPPNVALTCIIGRFTTLLLIFIICFWFCE